MARRAAPPKPESASLSTEQMEKGIRRLNKQISEIEAFDVNAVTTRWSPEQSALQKSIEGTLSSVFGHDTVEYIRYSGAAKLDNGPISMSVGWIDARGGSSRNDAYEARKYLTEGKERAIRYLKEAIKWLQDELEMSVPVTTTKQAAPSLSRERKIFIVHGHDNAAREAVARFIEKIGFKPIILHEQPNQGRTVIEKVEAHGDVGFAIVLLTPDDVGNKVGENSRPRPRQNVLLELGYFIGRLGRANVCTLSTSDEIEIPTDFAGVVWEKFDAAGGWKTALGKELQATGYSIDWNAIMNPS